MAGAWPLGLYTQRKVPPKSFNKPLKASILGTYLYVKKQVDEKKATENVQGSVTDVLKKKATIEQENVKTAQEQETMKDTAKLAVNQ